MARILDKIVVEHIGPGMWMVYDDIVYHVGSPTSPEVIVVPKGFTTDFASVPFGFRNMFPKDGKYTPAAILHDYEYSTVGLYGRYSRKQCDKIFLEVMEVVGVGWLKRRIMYRSVRLFGWMRWNQAKKMQEKKKKPWKGDSK